MTELSYALRSAVLRLADAPQRTLSKITAHFTPELSSNAHSQHPPAHDTARLENVFVALSELAQQPHTAAALELACDTVAGELPSEALAAGLYDIDTDEIRFVVARGVGDDLLRGTALPRAQCLVGYAAEGALITRADEAGADWLGSGASETPVLLCPILSETSLMGVLALSGPQGKPGFDAGDVELLEYIAQQLATFIQSQWRRANAPTLACR